MAQADDRPLLTIQELSKSIDRSEQSIRNWVKQGLKYERIDDRMRFDLDHVFEWLAKRENARTGNKGRPLANPRREAEEAKPGGKDELEVRKLVAEIRLKEIKAAELEGLLVPHDLPDKAVAAQAYAIRQQALALPRALAGQLVGLTEFEIEDRLRAAVDRMLTTLADTDLAEIASTLERDGGDTEPNTDDDD